MKEYWYPAVFTLGRKISIWFPDFDAATSGENYEDAIASAHKLLAVITQGIAEGGLSLPQPTLASAIPLDENQITRVFKAVAA